MSARNIAECRLELLEADVTPELVGDIVENWFPHVPPNPFPEASELGRAFVAAIAAQCRAFRRQARFEDQMERGGPEW